MPATTASVHRGKAPRACSSAARSSGRHLNYSVTPQAARAGSGRALMRRNAGSGSTGHSGPSASLDSTGTSSLSDLLEDEELECPLCLEEIDLTDLHFKPCPCGYQICRFCWHHIKENLNGRCPACRTLYSDEAVRFRPMKPDELKRLQAAKKQREKEKKETELLSISRKPLANVRVKHKGQVHIRGLTARSANEDTLPTLRDNEHYGKFGRISKIFLSRNTSTSSNGFTHPNQQPVNLYINFVRPQDAAACISAIDGTYTADGNELRASWGTTKYCTAFLRGQKCLNDNCQQAHEMGEEVDLNDRSARQELSSMKHAMKESEVKAGGSGAKAEAPGLPATASWASKNAGLPPQPRIQTSTSFSQLPIAAPAVSSAVVSSPAATSAPPLTSPPVLQAPIGRGQRLPRPLQQSVPPPRQSGARSRPNTANKENGIVHEVLNKAVTEDAPAAGQVENAGPVASTSSGPPTPPVIEEVLPAFEDADFALIPPPVASDFDRTLDTFASGSFSFSLRADVKGKERAPTDSVLKASARPSPLSMRAALDQIRPDNSPSTPYSGAFDPFGGGFDVASPVGEDDRRTSRFGFARRTSTPVDPIISDTSSIANRPLASVTRHSSPASAVDELGAAAQLWASARSPLSQFSPSGMVTAASVPLPSISRSGSAALLSPVGGAAHLSLPPGLGGGLGRSQGPVSTAAAYALPPPPPNRSVSGAPPGLGRDGADLFALLGSSTGPSSKTAENPSDPAIVNFGLSSSTNQPASAAYIDLMRSPDGQMAQQDYYSGIRR